MSGSDIIKSMIIGAAFGFGMAIPLFIIFRMVIIIGVKKLDETLEEAYRREQ